MSKIKTIALGIALLFSGSALATSAGAVTVPAGNTKAPIATMSDVQQVDMNNWYFKHRFRHRDDEHHFFRNGFWYTAPFWLDTAPLYAQPYGYGYGNGHGDSHVAACSARYRSYDPDSDTFMGYDGLQHPCTM